MARRSWLMFACALGLSGSGVFASSQRAEPEPARAKVSHAPASTGAAHAAQWQPAPGLTQVPIWPDGVPIQRPETNAAESIVPEPRLVGGRPWTFVTNISRPTMTVYPPTGPNTGAAVMVLPGGGYYGVAIDLEGSEVCDWITRIGLTCILLKYRSPQDWHKDGKHQAPAVQMALQDAQRNMASTLERSGSSGSRPAGIWWRRSAMRTSAPTRLSMPPMACPRAPTSRSRCIQGISGRERISTCIPGIRSARMRRRHFFFKASMTRWTTSTTPSRTRWHCAS
jgi:hypothetical protein